MRRALAILAVVLLTGCATGGRNAPPAVYDFGAPLASWPVPGAWSQLVVQVRSPAWFDTLNVDYRLAYDDPLVLREYAGSRWVGAPGVLLAQRLEQWLGAASAERNGPGVCRLRIDLQEFAQRFDTPLHSVAVLQAKVGLFDEHRQCLGERLFTLEIAAASPDAQGGARALVDAGNELGRRVADWLDTFDKKSTGYCRSQPSMAR